MQLTFQFFVHGSRGAVVLGMRARDAADWTDGRRSLDFVGFKLVSMARSPTQKGQQWQQATFTRTTWPSASTTTGTPWPSDETVLPVDRAGSSSLGRRGA